MGEQAPGIGQPFQTGSIAQDRQVLQRSRVGQVVDSRVEARPQGKGIDNFADSADRLGSPATVLGPSEDALRARKTVPGTPVLGKDGQRPLKRSNCLLRPSVVFQIPAAAKPPEAGIASSFGPSIKQNSAALRLTGISKSSNQSFSCADVIGVAAQQGIERGQQCGSIGIPSARSSSHPLPECNLRVDIRPIGLNPPLERRP